MSITDPNDFEKERNGRSNGAVQSALVRPNEVSISTEPRVRYEEGWRAGKPEEDPEKLKKWGFITARPSEYLVHMRGGVIRERSSGQGATCFKLPGDSVAVIPTTVQRLQFTADQVTSEKAGVQVTGLAVYRIADPRIAFRMLNFSFPERASEKLEHLLSEMFIGAARRLVANLTVEACLTKRKEGLATELMREIAPVVSGTGRVEDRTQAGWGVVIDTIEIQDVRVLSQAVFGSMQARFRNEQERQAREAELGKERALKSVESESQRQIALTAIANETEVRKQKLAAEEKARLDQLASDVRLEEARFQQERQMAAERERGELETIAAQARFEEAKVAHERQTAAARKEAELERLQTEVENAAVQHQAALAALHHQLEATHAHAELAVIRRRVLEEEVAIAELEARRLEAAQKLELARVERLKVIENTISPEAIQLAMAKSLPQVAAAFQQKMGEVHVTAVDGANPFGYIAAAVEGVMGLARSTGIDLTKKK